MPEIKAIDINVDPSELVGVGTAYFRISKELKEFLQLCQEKHNIIGFEWDTEDANNFGVILGAKNARN